MLNKLTAQTWTVERIEKLIWLWNNGKTTKEIASLLGDGITKNSVIGKKNRLEKKEGVVFSSTVRTKKRQKAREEAKMPIARFDNGSAKLQKPEPPTEPLQACAVTILELTSKTCRYPLGKPEGGEFLYCGALDIDNTKKHGVYCAYHTQRCYRLKSKRSVLPRKNRVKPNYSIAYTRFG